MDINEIIKHMQNALIARGMTQQELADKINKTLSSVKKYETGKTILPFDVLLDILKVLDIDLYLDFKDKTLLRTYIESKTNNLNEQELREMEIFIKEYIEFKVYKEAKE